MYYRQQDHLTKDLALFIESYHFIFITLTSVGYGNDIYDHDPNDTVELSINYFLEVIF